MLEFSIEELDMKLVELEGLEFDCDRVAEDG